MVHLTFVLWEYDSTTDGKYPIYLRITVNRKVRYVHTNLEIEPKYWNPESKQVRKNHPSHSAYNRRLDRDYTRVKTLALELQGRNKVEPSADTLKQLFLGGSQEDFIPYAKAYRDELEASDKYWSYRQVRPVIDKIEEFAGGDNLLFGEIDASFLRKFERFLKVVHENKPNTIYKNLAVIRRIFRRAVKDGLIQHNDNPFLDYPLKKGKVRKAKLTIEEIQKIEDVQIDPESYTWHARNYFLFSFYNGGVRFNDICQLQWKNIRDDRLHYDMHKTGTVKNIKLIPKSKQILENYKPNYPDPNRYIFPLLDARTYGSEEELQKAIEVQSSLVNRHLKKVAEAAEIDKNISFHIARHSFADYARQQGMDLYNLSKALGHSSLQITENYLKSFDEESLDDAMNNLFGFSKTNFE